MSESTHPSPEVLAAFVDGRLAGDARAEVVAHLDRCRDCYEVFAGTVRFQRQEEPRGRVLRPARFGAPQWVWWTAAAAAVLVVAIVVPVVWDDLGLGGTDGEGEALLATADLATALGSAGAEASAAAWQGWLDGGRGFAAELDRERASFRAGVWLMDLAAAARAGEIEAAGARLDELVDVLDRAAVAADLDAELDAAREALEDEDARALERAVVRIEAGAEAALDPFHLAFGKWAEAGRLAAGAGQVEFFGSVVFTGFREALDERLLPGPVAEAVGRVEALTRGEQGAAGETAELLRALEALIRRAG